MVSLHKKSRHIGCKYPNVSPAGDQTGKHVTYSLFSSNTWQSSNHEKKTFKPTKKPQPHFCIQRGLCFKSESPGSKGLWGLVKKSSLLFLPQQILILNFTLWVFTPFPVSISFEVPKDGMRKA